MAWFLFVLLPLLAFGALYAAAYHSRGMPPAYGLEEGRLRPCPDTPNCVSSEQGAAREAYRVAPLPLAGRAPEAAWVAFQQAVERASGEPVIVTGNYLVATFRTPVLGFVDDLEARLDVDAGVIHMRSASRVGHADFSANRRRLARVATLFLESVAGPGA